KLKKIVEEDTEYLNDGEICIGKALSASKTFKSNIIFPPEIILQQQYELKYPDRSVKEIEEVSGKITTKGSLDLSAYPDLEKFIVFNNITSINISNNDKLEILELPFSEVKDIDLSNNPNLKRLQLGSENLISLAKNSQLRKSEYANDKMIQENC
ncbi:1685_t:CDS:1, partial [Funneliformis caledonium]